MKNSERTSQGATGITMPKGEIRKGDVIEFPRHAGSTQLTKIRVTSVDGNQVRGKHPVQPKGHHGWREYYISHVHNVTLLERTF